MGPGDKELQEGRQVVPIRVQVPGHGIVEFPDGTPEQEMRDALISLDAPAAPAAPAVSVQQSLERGPSAMGGPGNATMQAVGEIGRAIKNHPATAGAMALSALAAPFTGGLSAIPAIAAMGAAGAAGAGAGNAIAGRPVTEGMAREALSSAAGPVVGRGMNAAGEFLSSRALPTVRAALKPGVAMLRRQAGASMTGIDEQANKVAGIVLRNRWAKPSQAIDAIQAGERGVQQELANVPPGTVLDINKRLPNYLTDLRANAGGQAGGRGDVAAIDAATDDFMHGPLSRTAVGMGKATQVLRHDVTPAEGLDIARKTSKWTTKRQFGELKGAEMEAHKTAERAIRDSVKDAAPNIRPHLEMQGEGLTALPFLDAMVNRTASRDVVSLPAYIAAAGGNNMVNRTAGAMLAQSLRNGQLRAGFGMDTLGPKMIQGSGKAATLTPYALRALLVGLMDEPSEEPPQK